MSDILGTDVRRIRVGMRPSWNLLGFPVVPVNRQGFVTRNWDEILLNANGDRIPTKGLFMFDSNANAYVQSEMMRTSPYHAYWINNNSSNSVDRSIVFDAIPWPEEYKEVKLLKNRWYLITPLSLNSNIQQLADSFNLAIYTYEVIQGNTEWVQKQPSEMELFKGYWFYISDESSGANDDYATLKFNVSWDDFSDYIVPETRNAKRLLLTTPLADPSSQQPGSSSNLQYTKRPLVSKWSDDIDAVKEENYPSTALTVQGIIGIVGNMLYTIKNWVNDNFYKLLAEHNVFAGDDILHRPVDYDVLLNTNINEYHAAGIYRIYDKRHHAHVDGLLEGTFPPLEDYTGYMEVFDLSDTLLADNPDKNKIRIRQTIYPDDPNSQSPWTRVGYAESKNGEIQWSEWSMMGGGMRRIVMESTVYESTCQCNAIYESYNSFDLQLPNPETVQVGTKICLEQYGLKGSETIPKGTVYCGNSKTDVNALVQQTEPETEYVTITDPSNNTSREALVCTGNAIVYSFECCHNDDGGTNEWIMDVTHDNGRSVANMSEQLANIKSALGRKCIYREYGVDGWDYSRLTCNSSIHSADDTNNMYWYDQYVIFAANKSGSIKFVLPSYPDIPNGAKITFGIKTGISSLTVKVASDSGSDPVSEDYLVRAYEYRMYTYVREGIEWKRIIFK